MPTIVAVAASQTPGQPWRDMTVACLIAATGLFLASYQLSIGSLYHRYRDSLGDVRAGLSFSGIFLLIVALSVFVAAVTDHWWVNAALVVFGIGGVAPIVLRGWLRLTAGAPLDRLVRLRKQ